MLVPVRITSNALEVVFVKLHQGADGQSCRHPKALRVPAGRCAV